MSASLQNALAEGDPLVFHTYPDIAAPVVVADELETKMVLDHHGALHILFLNQESPDPSSPYTVHHYSERSGWTLLLQNTELPVLRGIDLVAAEDGTIWAIFLGANVGSNALFTRHLRGDIWSPELIRQANTQSTSDSNFQSIALRDEGIAIVNRGSVRANITKISTSSPSSNQELNLPTGNSYMNASIAEKPAGGFGIAVWTFQTNTTTNIRTYTLRYAEVATDFSGAPAWETVEEVSETIGSFFLTQYTGLLFDSFGEPFISHWNQVDDELKISYRIWNSWFDSTVAGPIGQMSLQELHFDENNRIAIAFHGSNGTPKLTARPSPFTGSYDSPTDLGGFISKRRFDTFVDDAGYLHYLRLSEDQFKLSSPLDITDLDKDGVPHAVELVLRRNPLLPSPPNEETELELVGNTPGLSFFTLSDMEAIPGQKSSVYSPSTRLTATVEGSKNLVDWAAGIPSFDSDLFSITGRGKIFIVSQTAEIGEEASLPFMRLRVVRDRSDPDFSGGL